MTNSGDASKEYPKTTWNIHRNVKTPSQQQILTIQLLRLVTFLQTLQELHTHTAWHLIKNLSTKTWRKPIGTIPILLTSAKGLGGWGQKNDHFCWRSVLFILTQGRWVGQKEPKMCWRNIGMVPYVYCHKEQLCTLYAIHSFIFSRTFWRNAINSKKILGTKRVKNECNQWQKVPFSC